jgi:hypothetical protein
MKDVFVFCIARSSASVRVKHQVFLSSELIFVARPQRQR